MLLAAAASAVLWMRSYHWNDYLYGIKTGDIHHQASSHRGVLMVYTYYGEDDEFGLIPSSDEVGAMGVTGYPIIGSDATSLPRGVYSFMGVEYDPAGTVGVSRFRIRSWMVTGILAVGGLLLLWRRSFQFSLQAGLIAMTLIALLLGVGVVVSSHRWVTPKDSSWSTGGMRLDQ